MDSVAVYMRVLRRIDLTSIHLVAKILLLFPLKPSECGTFLPTVQLLESIVHSIAHFPFPLMKNTLFILLTTRILSSYGSTGDGTSRPTENLLDQLNDVPQYNKHFLKELIENINPTNKFAVFDYDGTLVLGDISAAIMYEQTLEHTFKIPVDRFKSLLSLGYDKNDRKDACLPLGMQTHIGNDLKKASVTFETLLNSLQEDYRKLKTEKMKEEESKTVSTNFRAKLGFYNTALYNIYKSVDEDNSCKMEIGLGEIPTLWFGLHKEEIMRLARQAYQKGLKREMKMTFLSSGTLEVEGEHYPGIRPVPQQLALIRALQSKKVKVHIVTAAPALVVEQLSEFYGVDEDFVSGVKLNFDTNGHCLGVDFHGATYGSGKVDKIAKFGLHNLILAVGDTMGDYELLQSVKHERGIKLIVNTIPSNEKMIELYEEACHSMMEYYENKQTSQRPRTLIQGVDHNAQKWIPTAYSKYQSSTLLYTATRQCEMYNGDHSVVTGYPVHHVSTPFVGNPSRKTIYTQRQSSDSNRVTGVPVNANCAVSQQSLTPCVQSEVRNVPTGAVHGNGPRPVMESRGNANVVRSCQGSGHDSSACNNDRDVSAHPSSKGHNHARNPPGGESGQTQAHDNNRCEGAQSQGCSNGNSASDCGTNGKKDHPSGSHNHGGKPCGHKHGSKIDKAALALAATVGAVTLGGALYLINSPKEQVEAPPDTNAGTNDATPPPTDGQSDSPPTDASTDSNSGTAPATGETDGADSAAPVASS